MSAIHLLSDARFVFVETHFMVRLSVMLDTIMRIPKFIIIDISYQLICLVQCCVTFFQPIHFEITGCDFYHSDTKIYFICQYSELIRQIAVTKSIYCCILLLKREKRIFIVP